MASRYEKNKKLYDKVNNGNFDSHNESIVDTFDFEGSGARRKYQENKKLSQYFKDIDDDLVVVDTKLDNLNTNETGMKIKDDVDLDSLIAQAKKKQQEDGGVLFSNTQHEILSNLEVETLDEFMQSDSEHEVHSLEDIIGQTLEIKLDEDLMNMTNNINNNNIDDDFDDESHNDFIKSEQVVVDTNKNIQKDTRVKKEKSKGSPIVTFILLLLLMAVIAYIGYLFIQFKEIM